MVKELNHADLKLGKLIQNKKELLKRYKTDRSRVDFEFNCSRDEINRLNGVYRQSLKEAAKVKEQLDELSNNGKNDKKWKKSKESLDRTCMKLHHTHNDYVFSLKVANKHHVVYRNSVVPYLLDSMQEIQEGYINEM